MSAIDVLDPSARRLLFEVLRCVARVSGPSDAEDDALRGAEVALGCPTPVDAPPPRALAEVPLRALPRRERMLFYVAAVWMTLVDGVRIRAETALLDVLAGQLNLSAPDTRFLARQARWARTSTGDEPAHRELDLLLTETARRLARIEALQAA